MQIFKINIDTNKPITQRIAVPQDCDKYGLVVNATTNGHPTRNLSCTIIDGDTTLTPDKVLDDGSQLFIMSSIGNSSRGIRVAVSARPVVINEGGTFVNDTGRPKFQTLDFPFAVGTYHKDEIDIFGYLSPDYVPPKSGYSQFKTDASQIDDVNADSWVLYLDERRLDLYTRTEPTQAVGWPLPPDEPIVAKADVTFTTRVSIPIGGSITIPPTKLGYNINCTIDVQLDERRDATPDGDIQLDPAIYDNFTATNLSADAITIDGTAYAPTTITIGGTDYTILAAQTTEAK